MRKLLAMAVVLIILGITLLYKSDQGTGNTARKLELESIRGDVVELQGKSMYYKNKYGSYPVHSDDVYSLSDGEVVRAIKVFERFFFNKETGMADKDYIRENIKLINVGELKDKGITYELSSKKTRYFLDTKTGKVLTPELMEEDPDYADEVTDTGEYRVIETIIIKDDLGNKMLPVHGSFKSGSSMYFYGGGAMKLARRDELTGQIINLDSETEGLSGVDSILYLQPSTGKCAVEVGGEVEGEVKIIRIKIQ